MPSGHFLTNQTPPSLPPHIDRRQIASAFDRTYQQVSTLSSSYATTPLDNLDNLDNIYIKIIYKNLLLYMCHGRGVYHVCITKSLWETCLTCLTCLTASKLRRPANSET